MRKSGFLLNKQETVEKNKKVKKFFVGLKRKGVKKCVPDVNYPVVPPDSPPHIIADLNPPVLLTYPCEKLHEFVKETLLNESSCKNSVPIELLPLRIEKQVNEVHPFSVPEQYDYCVICVQDDYDEAIKLKQDLHDRHGLKGYVIWDSVGLGMDQFFAFEDCIVRSTKILFYVSDNFILDEFCCHLVRNTVLCPQNAGELKVVPVLKSSSVKVPESMQLLELVDRLTLDNMKQFDFRLPCIFNNSVKGEKLKRAYALQIETDTVRRKYVVNVIKKKFNPVNDS